MGITPVDTGAGTAQDGRMRENDDDAPASEPQGSLADGLGETMEREHETSGDPSWAANASSSPNPPSVVVSSPSAGSSSPNVSSAPAPSPSPSPSP